MGKHKPRSAGQPSQGRRILGQVHYARLLRHNPKVYRKKGKSEFGISPCDIFKYYNTIPQVYEKSSYGWVLEDFAECKPEDVPLIAEAFYNVLNPGEPGSPQDILGWWASMPPEFYIGSASFPAVVADYFTTKEKDAFQNVPGRQSSQGKQGPEVDNFFGDDEAICTTVSCCPLGHGIPDSVNEACLTNCNTGNKQLEQIFAKVDSTNPVGRLEDMIKLCLNITENTFVHDDPNDPKRFCVMAGQYVDKKRQTAATFITTTAVRTLFLSRIINRQIAANFNLASLTAPLKGTLYLRPRRRG